MRTYAEYLNSLTVKTLNIIAKQMNLSGYSKLRKAELIEFIDNEIAKIEIPAPAKVETVESAIMNELAVIFSNTPAKAPEIELEAMEEPEAYVNTLQDLKDAYVNMRATVNKLRGGPSRIRIVGQLRLISSELKSFGINPAYL